MKKILLALSAIIPAALLAQPVYNELPAAGDSVAIFEINPSSITTAGPAGANVTWNFSTVQINPQYSFAVAFKPAAGTPYFSKYPTADLSNHMYLNGFPTVLNIQYLDISNNQVSFLGQVSTMGDDVETLPNPESEMPVPLTYGGTYSDTYVGYEVGEDDSVVERGTVNYLVDGYGKLILPTGTLHDVVRIRQIETYVDSAFSSGGIDVQSSTDTSYHWKVNGSAYDVFYLSRINTNKKSGQVVSDSYKLVGISSISRKQVAVYPNPAENQLYLSGVKAAQVAISDLQGRTVLSTYSDGSVDIGNLNSGLYFIQVVTVEGVGIASFVKQ